MIPVVKRNLPEAEQLLLASAALLVKAYGVAGGEQTCAISYADDAMTQAAWNYYSALVEEHPETRGATFTEWRDQQRLHVAPAADNHPGMAEAITVAIGQVAQTVAAYMDSKKPPIPVDAKAPATNPIVALEQIFKYINAKDPMLAAKLVEFLDKHGFPWAEKKPPEPSQDEPDAAQDDPTPPDSPKVPEGHICEPGKELCCTECTFGKEPGKCSHQSPRAMYVDTDRVAHCNGFNPIS